MGEQNVFTRWWILLILFEYTVLSSHASTSREPLYRKGTFPFSKCRYTSNGVSCEALNISKERQEAASVWPPGPYATRMSSLGCPEWQSRGWRKGLLIIKAAKDERHWKLHFCAKIRHNLALDKGKWIPGNFSIYRIGKACQEGFTGLNLTWTSQMSIRTVSHYGHVPDLEVYNTTEKTSIVFHMCARFSGTSTNDEDFGMLETEFILGKKEIDDCPQIGNAFVRQISLDDGTVNSYCSFSPHSSLNRDRSDLQLMSDFNMSKGSFAMSGLVMRFFVSEGIVDESESIVEGNVWVWYQFDLQRTLSMLKIVIQLSNQDYEAWTEKSKYIYCFFDNARLSFLRLEAASCRTDFTNRSITSLELKLWDVNARFITLVFIETMEFPTIETKNFIEIFTSDFPEECSEDLGMGDGSIQDLQITASSSLLTHLPSAARPLNAGWCTDVTDTKPWILVDLVAVTVVEGVSIWKSNKNQRKTTETGQRMSSFYLYYGEDSKNLILVKETNFETESSALASDVYTTMLLNPIEARYVKLEIHGSYENGNISKCLKFELHGCKLSGIPTFNCPNEADMFESEVALISDRRVFIQTDNITDKSCTYMCLKSEHCSVTRFKDENCFHYMSSRYGMWEKSEITNGTWFAKLCATEPIGLYQPLKSADGSIMTNVEFINENAVLTSIGYPFSFGTGQKYIWIVQITNGLYPRLVFTNVSLGQVNQDYYDKLIISQEFEPMDRGREIDYSFNGRAFVVETDKSFVIISFTSCLAPNIVLFKGFRAVIIGEEIPACHSKSSDISFGYRGYGICNKPEMFVTSMSMLNYPFVSQEEEWEIRVDTQQTVQLHMISFYVACPRDEEDRSRFAIVDASEKTYCNTDLPPDIIYSETSTVKLIFQTSKLFSKMLIRKEGFRLRFSTINDRTDSIEFSRKSTVKVCSHTFGKCYYVLRLEVTWDMADEICRRCNMEIVSVTSRDEWIFVNSILNERVQSDRAVLNNDHNNYLKKTAHIGLRRQLDGDGKRKFMWKNGSPMTYSAWKAGYPDHQSDRDCIIADMTSHLDTSWINTFCTLDTAFYFVCQSFKETNYQKHDQDLCMCQNGWLQNSLSCYYFSDEVKDWHNASLHCQRLQSQLVEINDPNENNFLYSRIDKLQRVHWIDLTKLEDTQQLFWRTSGNPLVFNDISEGFESDHLFSQKNCVRINGPPPKWMIESCGLVSHFVCEDKLPIIEDLCAETILKTPTLRHTFDGRVCKHWNQLTKKNENDFRTRFPTGSIPFNNSNKCTDVSNSGVLLCYAGLETWDPCFIKNYQIADTIFVNVENVARGKRAYQSDTYDDGSADRAVDGNIGQMFKFETCTHTASGKNKFWEVDLNQTYFIEQVNIYNRQDCCADRLRDVQLLIRQTGTDYSLYGYQSEGGRPTYTFEIPEVVGSWVRITRNSSVTEPLTLCEVQILGRSLDSQIEDGDLGNLENVALGKRAYQSDTRAEGGSADRAVDGNIGQMFSFATCTHTASGTNAFWEVDLNQAYFIEQVKIYNRQDCCADRLRDVQLLIRNGGTNYLLYGYQKESGRSIYNFELTPAVFGNWVRITRNSSVTEYLSLCEVQIFGRFRLHETLWGSKYIYQNGDSNDVFQCEDRSKIPIFTRCDGAFNCMDLTDEMYCSTNNQYLTNDIKRSQNIIHYKEFESATHFLCGSEEWISILAKCDDIIDCLDASDETHCSEDDTGLSKENSTCNDERCSSAVCDFTSDVTAEEDFSELLRECTSPEFTCQNSLCIPINRKCDGFPDCIDKSDETQCDSCKESFHCDTVKCIPLQRKCDRYADCEDGSDERSCDYVSPSSCDQLWKQGTVVSGQYNIAGLPVFCDFYGTSEGKISMSIRNIDIDINKNQGKLYTRTSTNDILYLKEGKFQDLVYRKDYTCVLEIRSACHIHYSIPEYSDAVYKCDCIVETYRIIRYPYENLYEDPDESDLESDSVKESLYKYIKYESAVCNDSKSTTKSNISSEYYNLTRDGDLFFDERVGQAVFPVQITPEINCIYDNTTENESMCKLCLYNGDQPDLISKCGSDLLENCADFICPENTVKCPGSYCIPLSLVCNNALDCPSGHDELECTCSNSAREVFILTEDSSVPTERNTVATKLAKQLYTTGSDIRILYFTTQTPLQGVFNLEQRLLEIREKRLRSFKEDDQIPDCFYKIMASNFLGSIRFSTSTSAKGIVFIEDTEESSKVAELMFTDLPNTKYPIYRVLKDVQLHLSMFVPNTYYFIQDIRIKRWSLLFSYGYRRFKKLYGDFNEVHVPCRGGYRCSASKQCLPLEKVCDGIVQCIGQDDEKLCAFACPEFCSCVGYSINCRAGRLKYKDVKGMSINTRRADLSVNPNIRSVFSMRKLIFPFMTRLNLSSCEIENIDKDGFYYLNNLRCLDIGYNRIESIPDNTFHYLNYLEYLNFHGNFELRIISSTAFHGLKNIKSLQITRTNLKRVFSNTFSGLNLQSIDISYNEIEEIEKYAFNNTSVDEIDFRGNNIITFNNLIFDGIISLHKLHSPAFKFCCIRPCYVAESKCFPKRDEFSSCEDLMRHPVLQAVLWLVGITAFLGNMFSILYRIIQDRRRLKIGYGIFVTNLAIADLLMGIYLITIAVADSLFRNRYIYEDENWRNSTWCTAAGVLSTVSSEASVLFVCLITLDRLLVIKYPFGTVKLTPKKALYCCIFCWIIAFTLALIPVVHTSYFQNQFYSRSGVCVALPLTADKPPGWQYSVSVFVGLNFFTFVLVAIGQCSIFLEFRTATGGIIKTGKSRKRDLRVARNLILIATTDFMCWFPIGLMGMMALSGYPITGEVYVWTAVFVLPFNSALNPILYTLSAILGKEKFNPDVEEQNRFEIKKEIGNVILRYDGLQQSIRAKTGIKEGKSVHDMMTDGERISTATVISSSMLLARYLSLLHEASMGIDRLSTGSTYITIKDKKTCIVLDANMYVANDTKSQQDEMYQFGLVLRRLLTLSK